MRLAKKFLRAAIANNSRLLKFGVKKSLQTGFFAFVMKSTARGGVTA